MPGLISLLQSFWMTIALLVVHLFLFFGTNVYWDVPTLGLFLHPLGGFVVGHGFVNVLRNFEQSKLVVIRGKWLNILMVVCLTTTVAVVWEFHEFLIQNSTGILMQPSIGDTMLDLLLGMLGSLLAAAIFYRPKK